MTTSNVLPFPSRLKAAIPDDWRPADMSGYVTDPVGVVAKRFADGDRGRVTAYGRADFLSPAFVVADLKGPGFTAYAYSRKSHLLEKLELPYE